MFINPFLCRSSLDISTKSCYITPFCNQAGRKNPSNSGHYIGGFYVWLITKTVLKKTRGSVKFFSTKEVKTNIIIWNWLTKQGEQIPVVLPNRNGTWEMGYLKNPDRPCSQAIALCECRLASKKHELVFQFVRTKDWQPKRWRWGCQLWQNDGGSNVWLSNFLKNAPERSVHPGLYIWTKRAKQKARFLLASEVRNTKTNYFFLHVFQAASNNTRAVSAKTSLSTIAAITFPTYERKATRFP